MNRALFKLAVEQGITIAIWSPNSRLNRGAGPAPSDGILPAANYNQDAVNYYKVGLASPFPSQSYLAFYHVLEYFFLTTQEGVLHDRIFTYLNGTSFKGTVSDIDRVISLIRNQDARADETEMLRSVMAKYIDEEEFIDFIRKKEIEAGDKIFTRRKKIFGEELGVSDQKGHAISNAAKLLKHVRNAIVHSSDRYKREDCHIPLSETEDLIGTYIPILKYCAERVIFGTAR